MTVAAADSAKVLKKSTAFLFIAKRNHVLCTLYINRRVNCEFYRNSNGDVTYTEGKMFTIKDIRNRLKLKCKFLLHKFLLHMHWLGFGNR